jgi:hypothetical protein
MTLSELKEQIQEDLKLHADRLNYDAIATPDIHNKYNNLYRRERVALKELQREWDVLYLQQWEYYRKKADPEVYEKKPLLKKIIDTDAKYYLAADPILQEQRAKIEAKEELLDYIKRALDQISQRTWLIRNYTEYLKFQNGDSPNKVNGI